MLKLHGEEDPTFEGTVEGLLEDTDLTVTYVIEGTDQTVGFYEGVLNAEFNDNPNYNVNVEAGNFTILAKEIVELGDPTDPEEEKTRQRFPLQELVQMSVYILQH
ncbi:MAG: hypothetical protein GX769_02240 [Erysipelothrix sp.]|nr:hypothetical protein [Erysipelothrix sp.]